jgi:hypothetical protein
MASKPTPTQEKGAEKPRYRLLAKAAFTEVAVVRGREVIPLSDVVLDPDEQPLANQLSGPFGGRGAAERVPLVIEYEGIPDEHMEPVNASAHDRFDRIDELKAEAHAEAQKRRRSGKGRSPLDELSIVGPAPTTA